MADSNQPLVVLVSGQEQNHRALGDPLERDGWRVHHARSFADFATASENGPAVVVTDYTLPDGPWTKVLNHARVHAPALEVVVYSPLADEHLWAEVICLGGFDVLSDLSDEIELLRVTSAALAESRIRSQMIASELEKTPVL
jgi:DNA-binding NtrC family response regulator